MQQTMPKPWGADAQRSRVRMSAWTKVTRWARSAWVSLAFATANKAGLTSIPVQSTPLAARGRSTRPVPQPISNTGPPDSCTRSITNCKSST